MKPIAEIVEPEEVGKILRAMGLPDPPPALRSRAHLRKGT
jgi:hypothetical protein